MTMGERIASKTIRLFAALRPDEYYVEDEKERGDNYERFIDEVLEIGAD